MVPEHCSCPLPGEWCRHTAGPKAFLLVVSALLNSHRKCAEVTLGNPVCLNCPVSIFFPAWDEIYSKSKSLAVLSSGRHCSSIGSSAGIRGFSAYLSNSLFSALILLTWTFFRFKDVCLFFRLEEELVCAQSLFFPLQQSGKPQGTCLHMYL